MSSIPLVNDNLTYSSFQAHERSSINALALIPSTSFYLSGGADDSLVKLHGSSEEDCTTHAVSTTALPKEHNRAVTCLDASQSSGSHHFISGGADGTMVLWDLVKQCRLSKYLSGSAANGSSGNSGIESIAGCRQLSPDLFVSCGSQQRIKFYDARAGSRSSGNHLRPIHSIKLGRDNLNAIDYDRDNCVIRAGSSDGNLYFVDLRQQQEITYKFKSSSSSSSSSRGGIVDTYYCAGLSSDLVFFENGSLVLQSCFDDLPPSCDIRSTSDSLSYKLNCQIWPHYHHDNAYRIISGSETGAVCTWLYDTTSQKSQSHPSDDTTVQIQSHRLQIPRESNPLVNVVVFDELRNRLICSSGDGAIHTWDNCF